MFSKVFFGTAASFGSALFIYGAFKGSYDFLVQCPPYDLEADLTGKTYIVTGATGGIGLAMAQKLADKNARVIMTYKNREKCTELRRDVVLRSRNKQVFCRRCDLSDFDSIQEFVLKLYKDEAFNKVDGLINSAAVVNTKRKLNKHGIEETLATNYLGAFLLTSLLLEKFLKQQAPAKIVFLNTKLAAEQNKELDLRKLFDPDGSYKYRWFDVYYGSKLALLMYAKELSERLKETDVSVVVADPGKALTKLFSQVWYERYFPARWSRRLFEFFTDSLKWPNEATGSVICAIINDDVKNGAFLSSKRESQPWGSNAENVDLRQQLWLISEQWTNVSSLLKEFAVGNDEQMPTSNEKVGARKDSLKVLQHSLMSSFSPVKGSTEDALERRLNQLCLEIWNLIERWSLINKECCAHIENISNSRISFNASNDQNKMLFTAEQIVRDSDHLCSTLLPSFYSIVNNLAKANQTILPLKCSIDVLAKREDFAASSSFPTLQRKVAELCEIFPSLLNMFQKELEFKKDSIEDLSFCDDRRESTIHLFSAILSSWRNYVYVDVALINCLYALIV